MRQRHLAHPCRTWHVATAAVAAVALVAAGCGRVFASRFVIVGQARPLARCRVLLRATEDPWAVLGVAQGSSPAEVKRAYRKRALKEHPDVNKAPDAKEQWQRLSSAYDTLSDPEKLRQWEAAHQGTRGGPQQGQGPRSSRQTTGQAGQSWQEPPRRQASSSSPPPDFADTAFRGAAAAAGFARQVAGVAGRAAQVAGAAGKAVLDSAVSPRVSRIARMKLDELLEFLSPSRAGPDTAGPAAGTRSGSKAQQLRVVELELERLQDQLPGLRSEVEFCERRAREMQISGDKQGELESLRRALAGRDSLKRAREEILRCYDQIDSLRSS
eukprot:TRINITY_DN64684_c0_g1_i1.p1 TRINITY_DN64684_c0_g1~~TRINITY_DN64684_c0_g1_i1.p1  ORF type:complete len:327 (-),score=70.98 TRINITY_DN64684_c0_g1_i1:22-1002(-)